MTVTFSKWKLLPFHFSDWCLWLVWLVSLSFCLSSCLCGDRIWLAGQCHWWGVTAQSGLEITGLKPACLTEGKIRTLKLVQVASLASGRAWAEPSHLQAWSALPHNLSLSMMCICTCASVYSSVSTSIHQYIHPSIHPLIHYPSLQINSSLHLCFFLFLRTSIHPLNISPLIHSSVFHSLSYSSDFILRWIYVNSFSRWRLKTHFGL